MTITQTELFDVPPPYISPADVDVHALSIPARAYTGDFFFTHRDGDRLWLAVGDVAGKGVHAAMVMVMIQEELERVITSCSQRGSDPAATMQRLHAFLRPLLPKNRFASAAVATLYDDGRLFVANAGHCPVLIARRDGTVEQIGSTGPVLGMLPSSRWSLVRREIACGDAVLIYSDGIVETRDGSGDEFGVERLARAASHPAADARTHAEAVVRAVRRHGTPDDDFTLLVARR